MKPRRAMAILGTLVPSADTRALALVRAALSVVLLVDLAGRLPDLALLYSSEGILPAHTLLLSDPGRPRLSYLLTTSRLVEVRVFFALAAGVYLALLVGWQTKLMQILSLVALVSLHNRAPVTLHAGDALLVALLAWTLLLPLGRHLSLDAWLRPPEAPPRPTTVRSLAVLGLWVELAAVLLLNVANRTDPAWDDGGAMHLLLWQDAIVRTPGLWLRTHAPPQVVAALGRAMNVFDLSLGLALLVPGRPRRFAAALLAPYLLGLSLLFNLGIHPLVVFTVLPLAVPRRGIAHGSDALLRRFPRLAPLLAGPPAPEAPSPADRLEAGLREALAASLLATFAFSVPAHNEGLLGSRAPKAPRWTELWNGALGIHHRFALFGGRLPRRDTRVLLAATDAAGNAHDLLTGVPATPALAAARGSRATADRIALDLHLASGWLPTLRGDVERFARRAHTLPWSAIRTPVVSLRALRLSRPIPPPGERKPPAAGIETLFEVDLSAPRKPSDVLLPPLARPAAPILGPVPSPDDPYIGAPLVFDLLQAPRVLRIEGRAGAIPLHFALDNTSAVSFLLPEVAARIAEIHPTAPDAWRIPLLEVGENVYRNLVFVPGELDSNLVQQGVCGVLGHDFLALHDVELDFARRTLSLWPAGTAGSPALPLDGLVALPLLTTPAGVEAVETRLEDRVAGLGVFAFHALPVRINQAAVAAFGLLPTDISLEIRYDAEGDPHFLRLLSIGRLAAGPVFARSRQVVVADGRTFDALGLGATPGVLLGLSAFPKGRAVFVHDLGILFLGASPHPERRP